ncbi:MAG: Transcriptional regulator [Moraxellaceae bacterium]|jgi:AcrR family transcriptional regulator|nr:Transcriptional regulator [Moraxellaceae bacterium]
MPTMKKPGVRTPRSRDEIKQETREALVRAASELFRTEGLDVSLDRVCAHAGYTRGAFYVHFRDRDDLIAVVMERVGLALLDTLLGKEDAEDDFFVLVQRFLHTVSSGQYPISRTGLRPYQLMDACARAEDVRLQYLRLNQVSVSRLATILQRGQKKGHIRQDLAAETVAQLLMAIVVGMQTILDLDMPLDLPGIARNMQRMLTPLPTAA